MSDRKMEQLWMILQDGTEVISGSGPRVERRVEVAKLVVARPDSGYNGQRPEEPISGLRLDGGAGRSEGGGYAELEG
ncbi:hypothetical protein C1H46_008723 [Malus baccata]|uniref:Uncharacterized protein n=1 Tax=Malus baccata TaxID=106549 RepID=A0A540N3W0_MALBA|nr:hypothetical protein C1H46_008723 [Malus baccata]